jgi:hypothetical protein
MLGGGELGCPDKSSEPRLGGWFVGWYLFALDARQPRDEGCAGTGYFANADLPIWKVSRIIARSHAIGRIVGPPRPSFTVLRPAVHRGDKVYVVSVRCPARCIVTLNVDTNAAGAPSHYSFRGIKQVGVSAANLAQGPLAVLMRIDDSPLLMAHTSLN